MKRLLLLLIAALISFSLHAQSPAKVSLRVSDCPLAEVLTQIQAQSGYTFFYSRDAVEMQKKVDFAAEKEQARTAITRLFNENGVNFTINGTDVIILAAKPAAKRQTVSGVLLDDMGYPLPGGGVMVAGTTEGVVTDLDGNYSIDVILPCALEFSYIGYVTQTKTVSDAAQPVNVQLLVNANELKEVVVVGYGTMEKREVTSSITSIKADNLIQGGGGASIATALRGEISGMTINTNSSPNAESAFQLRGVSSINADDSPLVVIDGIPGGHLSSLNQDEIESIDVLKDASAGAIYGTRAAGGVILVTTKKAKEGSFKISYTGEVSTEAVTARPRVLTRERYLKYDLGADYGFDMRLSNGENIPTLEQFLEQGKQAPQMKLICEIKYHNDGNGTISGEKTVAAAEACHAIVSAAGMTSQVEYISVNAAALKRLAVLSPGVMLQDVNSDYPMDRASAVAAGIKGINYDFNKLTDAQIADAHEKGMVVGTWTVDKEEDMRTMINRGVDFITTNEPVLLQQVLETL